MPPFRSSGKARPKPVDNECNDEVDDVPTKGSEDMGRHVPKAIKWLDERHDKYSDSMTRTHKVIVEVMKAEKLERARRAGLHKLL